MQSTANKVVITGDDLTVEDVVRVARGGARVKIAQEALQRVRRARDVVDRVLERGDVVYGLNTGVGSLARYRVPLESLEQFSMKMVLGHIARHGQEVETAVVRQ